MHCRSSNAGPGHPGGSAMNSTQPAHFVMAFAFPPGSA